MTDTSQLDAAQNILSIATELREKLKISDVEYKSALDKVSKDLNKYIDENEAVKKELVAAKHEQEKQSQILSALEKHAAIGSADGISVKNKSLNKSLNYIFEKTLTSTGNGNGFAGIASMDKKFAEALTSVRSEELLTVELRDATDYIAGKAADLANMQTKAMRTDVEDQGGFLVPPEFSLNILKRGTEISPIRQYATVLQTYSNVMNIPLRDKLANAYMEWEAVPSSNKNSASNTTYGRASVHMKRMGVKIPVSHEMLIYSPFDMQSLVAEDVVESFARKEGDMFINGGGTLNDPAAVEGILSADIQSYQSTSKTLTADDMLSLQGEIKWKLYGQQQYDRTYILNRRTLVQLLTTNKTTTGLYLWNIGSLQTGFPDSIGGYSYVVCPDMPDVAPGATPVVLGDLKRAYTIVDRLALYMSRDDLTDAPNVNFSFFKYFGAKVAVKEALIKLTLAK